ncbi:MAG: ATP-binding cassette domain-containing protein [Nitrospirales bacterium]|nr:ATP-binding cassette domain-containing protein [Nitrospirales bacterium]
MIAVHNLHMQLNAGHHTVTILSGISFEIPNKQVTAIIGPSGSGKSTLLGLLAGLDRPTAGTIQLNGQEITHWSEHDMAQFRRQSIGYVFQSFHLIPTLTALENVTLPLDLSQHSSAKNRAQTLLDMVGLQDRLHHYPVQLSGGEQQRVAVARAFACSPPILFADEPTGNLDSNNGEHIIQLLLQLNREHDSTLVLVTHDTALANQADRVLTLQDGHLVSDRLLPSD